MAPATVPPRRPLAIIIPAFRGAADMHVLLDALTCDAGPETVIVVDDASPEPALRVLLRTAEREGRIGVVRHRRNRGFPAAVNGGIRAARRHLGTADILLLNSDTIVPPGTAGRLHDLLYAEPEIASITPLSNEATIMSYPRRRGDNPCPEAAEFLARNAALFRSARGILAPSADVARRLRRHLPGVASIAVTPWEDDATLPPAKPPRPGRRRIALAGGIGPAKGYDILLSCVEDAATRDLPLDFVVVGAADGEQPLIDTGRVLITGPPQHQANRT